MRRTHEPGSRWSGYGLAAAGATLFATKGVIIKLAYQLGVTTEALLTLRLMLSAPVYLGIGVTAILRGRAMPDLRLMGRAALVGALGYWFASYTDFLGLKYISVQFERLILFTYPAFVLVFGALFFRQPLKPSAFVGVAVSYGGLVLMFASHAARQGQHLAHGALLVLGSAIAFAFYQLLAKGVIARMGARLFTCVAMLGATAATLTQFALTQPPSSLMVGTPAMGYAIALAIGATIIPSFFLNMALERISAQANGAIGTISPVVTIALAVVVLGEKVTWIDVAATLLVLAGVAWFTLGEGRPRPRPEAAPVPEQAT